jgi:cell fate regulator YaaT (PSP1 superfamily)
MGCCEGSCSCGKGNQSPVQENIALVQMSTNQGMLSTTEWKSGLQSLTVKEEVVEVRFKNNRKAFFRNYQGLRLHKDDRVVVETEGGHDVGTIALTGDLAEKQFEQKSADSSISSLRRIYRKATEADVGKWLQAKRRERDVLIQSRKIAKDLSLTMSIGDVEFQGDGKKVTVYYTADGRIDYRELIRMYAADFRVRIEMKQIGTRQNAAKIGGIGSCGRELCCSTWKTDMNTVKTDAARTQNLSLNVSKLAGQCGKLKCCLNYELDTYLEAWEQFPKNMIELETDKGIMIPIQPDVLKGVVYYTLSGQSDRSRYIIPIDQVKVFISQNKKGEQVRSAGLTSTNTSVRGVQSVLN